MHHQITFIAGIHAVKEAINYNADSIDYCIILKQNSRIDDCLNIIKKKQIKCINNIPTTLISQLEYINHQGIIAIQKNRQPHDLITWAKQWQENLRLVILDGVQDPRNLGSCIRTACAGQCHGIIIPKNHNASIKNPTTQKVASGACSILPIFEVTNINRTIADLKKIGVWCYGFSEHGRDSLYSHKFTGPTALVFGAEATGLKQSTQKNCDYLVNIPTNPSFPTLNLAVSVGIGALELLKQKQDS